MRSDVAKTEKIIPFCAQMIVWGGSSAFKNSINPLFAKVYGELQPFYTYKSGWYDYFSAVKHFTDYFLISNFEWRHCATRCQQGDNFPFDLEVQIGLAPSRAVSLAVNYVVSRMALMSSFAYGYVLNKHCLYHKPV